MPETFFKRHLQQMVYEALTHENVRISQLASAYTINMLADFIDAEKLTSPDGGFPVLTWLYRDAMSLTGHQRIVALRKLGDISLFLVGLFSDYVRKTANGLGYYIDMGCSAYGTVARMSSTLNPVYDELSRKFVPLVGALNFISVRSSLSREPELDDLFELYIRDSANITLQSKITAKSSIPIISTVGLS